MTTLLIFVAVLLVMLAAVAGSSIRVLREYERAVVFRLGRLVGERAQG